MNRLALSLSLVAFSSIAPQVLARPVVQSDAPPAQVILDRLVQEPLRFEGGSSFPLGFRQAPGYEGKQPTRVLIGYHMEGSALRGEFVALDADNRALQAAPLSGLLTPVSQGAGAAPCHIDIALQTPLQLEGHCAPDLISGAYVERVPASPLLFLIPGLDETGATTGQYMMKPWRG
ncbi:hypothetical protein [Asaia krungthepensis]|uniref:Uncharacterized protein n=1 Tax=Asaia krungthepensis NRIC 0535 TaxID=1307925 RepID=A0ABQ0Q3Z7_9PROT|nr:hypothetical protein [Asaia krungthepensis]GBQ90294.1 hypothetical protein AA0535_2006 [Asaia krungthepensis NRIC 0535]